MATQKQQGPSGFVLGIVAVILSLALFAGGAALGWTAKTKGWFDDTKPAEKTESGGMQLPEDTENESMSLRCAPVSKEQYASLGVPTSAETAFQVTATVKGDNLTTEQQKVSWSLAWNEGYSKYAESQVHTEAVTDYINFSNDQTPEGNVATVYAKKAFDCEALVIATSTFNPSKSASVKVNYKQKWTYKIKAEATDLIESPDKKDPAWGSTYDMSWDYDTSNSLTLSLEANTELYTIAAQDLFGNGHTAYRLGVLPYDHVEEGPLKDLIDSYAPKTIDGKNGKVTYDHFFDGTAFNTVISNAAKSGYDNIVSNYQKIQEWSQPANNDVHNAKFILQGQSSSEWEDLLAVAVNIKFGNLGTWYAAFESVDVEVNVDGGEIIF